MINVPSICIYIPGPIASSLPTLLTNRRLNPILAPLKSVHKDFVYNGVHWSVMYSHSYRFHNKSIFFIISIYNAGTANLALLVKSFLYIAHLNFPISSNIPLNIFKDNKNAHWQFYGIRKTFNATSLVISEYYSHKFHPATRHQQISSFWVNFPTLTCPPRGIWCHSMVLEDSGRKLVICTKRNMCPCFKNLSPPKSCVYCSNNWFYTILYFIDGMF